MGVDLSGINLAKTIAKDSGSSSEAHYLALIWADSCLSSRITGTKLGLWNFAFYVHRAVEN
jgi:hypothetical protein